MSTKDKDRANLKHILECIDEIPVHLEVVHKLEKELWHEHPTTRQSVLRTLQTMSESCHYLSVHAKSSMPEIEWKKISAFRHVLVHDYLGDIDYSMVTLVIEKELPKLKTSVSKIYKERYD